MKNIFLHSLTLENYRNFKNLELKTDNTPIILIGENGSGKTNILEAISLFYPGRGLRSAKLADICKASEDQCLVKALLQSKLGLAKFCSTGEQKAILIAIILAEMNYAIKLTKIAPILLLDEVFVHLDNKRRGYLIEFFTGLNMQLWVTATDLEGIENFANKAQLIKL
ncbi:MAG: AAA family ATPase [Rickettsia endosymbiont of Glossina mortisans submortisans]|nr:AAA family ATPase [Rickettsia endosymbiont of Glossina mortisans submortisans]